VFVSLHPKAGRIVDAAKFALGHGFVMSTPFLSEARMNGL
jgi:hypothetical protein